MISGAPQAPNVVHAEKLTKFYGSLEAVKQIDLDIRPGEVFGLIGPDGAGKTTTFHMLGGILDPSGGTLSVLNEDAHEARLRIGYLTQKFSLYPDLSIQENMAYAAGLRSVGEQDFKERSERYLKLMDLARFRGRLASNLSGGMKQKLALCCALIARPELLLLDEPTTGVDPVSRRDFWDVLSTVAEEGVTIAVATPYIDEAERCSRVALMHKGQIIEQGTPTELKQRLGLHRIEVRDDDLPRLAKLVRQVVAQPDSGIEDSQEFGDRFDVLTADVGEAQNRLRESAERMGLTLHTSVQEPTLENVFALAIRRLDSEASANAQKLAFPFVSSKEADPGIAIQASHLTKNFGSFRAVDDVNIAIEYGQIYGLLGANGAGKTTTIKMLCGLLEPNGGEMRLAGKTSDLRNPNVRRRLGYMSQKFTLYEDLTVLQNLNFYAGIYQVEPKLLRQRIDWVLKTTGLESSRDMLAGDLPGGYRQRLAFGATVLHQPQILFLDEPTSGVDPIARRDLWTLIKEFATHETAILVTTHFLEEAEYCQNLGFMVAGRVVASGAPFEIKKSQPGKLLEVRTSDNQNAARALREQVQRWQVSIFGDSLHIVIENDQQGQQLLDKVKAVGINVIEAREIPFSMEDAFIGIVERSKELSAA